METVSVAAPPASAFQIASAMSVVEAIQSRRSVRAYLPEPVGRDAIDALLQAAVAAPTAMHEEPWAFGIVQDTGVLRDLSRDIFDRLKAAATAQVPPLSSAWTGSHADAFHGANTLIVIYSRLSGRFAAADCWLAAENLMLMARALDLASCVIGMAVDALNDPKWRARLGVGTECTAVAPIVIGTAAARPGAPQRRAPQIAFWVGGSRDG